MDNRDNAKICNCNATLHKCIENRLQESRSQGINPFHILELERAFRCHNHDFGCQQVLKTRDEFGSHLENCPFELFSTCHVASCPVSKSGDRFASFPDLVQHYASRHQMQSSPPDSNNSYDKVLIPKKVLTSTDPDLDYVMFVNIFEIRANLCDLKICVFLNVRFLKEYGAVVVPFAVKCGENETMNCSSSSTVRLDSVDSFYEFAVQGIELDTVTIPSEIGEEMVPSVYQNLACYVHDRKDIRFFVPASIILENVRSNIDNYHRQDEVVPLCIETLFQPFRVETKFFQRSVIEKRMIWSFWETLGRLKSHPDLLTCFELNELFKPTGVSRPTLSFATGLVHILILEAKEDWKIMLCLISPQIAPFCHRRWVNPRVYRYRKSESKARNKKPKSSPYSSRIIIFTEDEGISQQIKYKIGHWFSSSCFCWDVYTGLELLNNEYARQRAVIYNILGILILTVPQLHELLQLKGEYLSGTQTKLIILYQTDRIFSVHDRREMVSFFFPTLFSEFRSANYILWFNKVLPETEQMLAAEVFHNKYSFMSLGAVGVLGCEAIQIDSILVNHHKEKQSCWEKFLKRVMKDRTSTHHVITVPCKGEQCNKDEDDGSFYERIEGGYKFAAQILIIVKEEDRIKDISQMVKTYLPHHEVKEVTKELDGSGNIEATACSWIIKTFLEKHSLAVIICTNFIATFIEIPKVNVVVMDGIFQNFCEFLRMMDYATRKVVIFRETYISGPFHQHFNDFLKEKDRLASIKPVNSA